MSECESTEGIKCPACGKIDRDELYGFTSYHGSDGHVLKWDCPYCESECTVEERVERTWISRRKK